jgi:L-iditol 2-dehydrogenase
MNTATSGMLAVRLHGPADMRVEHVAKPGSPGPREALIRVKAVGVCGSDLHTWRDGRIGDTVLGGPVILGHEFAGVVEAVGSDAIDGCGRPLAAGARVAVDPAQPCWHCDLCERGHPNLCCNLHFVGLFPDDGALCQWIRVPGRTCFPIPDSLTFADGALLEMLGIAIHATDLARIRVGDSVAIVGAGPIGLSILQMVRLSGADPIFVTEQYSWRLELAARCGAAAIDCQKQDPVAAVRDATGGRGVDVAIEAAWADHSVQQAVDMLRMGGLLVQVGVPGDDRMELRHSSARRKGLTIKLARRMKHTYPRAIRLTQEGRVDLRTMVTHRFPLERVAEAFALNAAYKDNVVKVVIDV